VNVAAHTVTDGDRHQGGWFCPTEADRVRLTDMSPAVRRARLLAGLFAGIGVLLLVPWIGWLPLAVFALAPAPLIGLDQLLARGASGCARSSSSTASEAKSCS
jgi:hypothetical protein